MVRPGHRDQGGIEGGVIGAVVAIAAGAVDVVGADRIGRQTQHLGHVALERVHALAVRPDRHVAILEPRQRARGRQ